MTYYRAVRAFSYFELALFTALLVVWLGELDPQLKTVLGWSHGFGWIGLCLLVANGCTRGVFPWPLLAATVSPAGPLGSSIGFLVLDRRAGARRSRPVFPLNLPNVLTLFRILLVPVLVVALLEETPNGDLIAAAVFALAAVTDGLDGYIARSREAITTFGKVMDPIADKLLVAAALISLVSLDRVAAWVAMVIIGREFAVSGLRIAAGARGVVISASALGKLKTTFQIAMVLALIAASDSDAAWVQAIVYAAVAITVVSGVDYFVNVRKRIDDADQAGTRSTS